MSEQIQPRLESAIGQRYEVIGPIGRGGMASVYLARHRVHGGFCAVKVLADHLAKQPPLVKSFLTEARASASLDEHPNIVNIVDIDEHAGLYYMIMKYVEGEDLSTYLYRKGKLPWKQAAYIAAEVAEALAFSHDRGVIHRDLKPGNIRLNRNGGVTVMDFGIAKVGQTPSSFTEMGARAGTPHYMAPEQIRGDKVDHRSDLYGLGVILYQMTTGSLPFDAPSPAMVWEAHLTLEPAMPQELEPSIPDALSHILLTLMAKDVDKRYDSAARVARHLRTLGLDGVKATLNPMDQLGLDQLRAKGIADSSAGQAFAPPPSVVETGPNGGPPIPQALVVAENATMAAPVRPPPPASAEPVPEAVDKRNLIPWVVAAALLTALAIGAFLYSGSGRSSAPPPSAVPAAAAPSPEPAATPEPEIAEPAAEPEAVAAAPAPPRKPAAPRIGAVYFRTEPPGARIQVDTRPDWTCESPCWIESLTAGEHNVTARLAGFRVAIEKIQVAAGGREPLQLQLEQDLISAMIASVPPGADIYIDGEKRSEKTNASIPLKTGTYQVRVVIPGVAQGEQVLVVTQSQMPYANFILESK